LESRIDPVYHSVRRQDAQWLISAPFTQNAVHPPGSSHQKHSVDRLIQTLICEVKVKFRPHASIDVLKTCNCLLDTTFFWIQSKEQHDSCICIKLKPSPSNSIVDQSRIKPLHGASEKPDTGNQKANCTFKCICAKLNAELRSAR
jgi:hypothetical protein